MVSPDNIHHRLLLTGQLLGREALALPGAIVENVQRFLGRDGHYYMVDRAGYR